MIKRLRLLAVLAAASAALACNRAGPPSPAYAEARSKWTVLLQERLDGAYSDPRADEVVALLGQVDGRSVDAPFAAQLLQEIKKGREDARRAAADSESQVAAAQDGWRQNLPPPAAQEAPEEPVAAAAPAEAPDAGAGPAQPKEGMDASEFKSGFARCFEYRHDALVGGMQGGQVYGLKTLGICRDLHPGFEDRLVLIFDGKVTGIRPASELAPKKYKLVDGKLVPVDEPAGAPAGAR